ncbi:MAG: HAD family hydrolase [Dermatophilus congolensis]|nr:HAD family hydrolase [Dermatophilus congolensis]
MKHDVWAEPIRGLLLDIDDTLVDTQAAMRGSCAAGAAAAWPDEAPELHTRISDIFYDDPAGHFDAYTRGEQDFPTMRNARYSVACRELGLADVRFDVFESNYRVAFKGSQRLFADALPMFDAADAAGIGVCLLTNSGGGQTEVKLEAVGLTGRAPMVTTDTLGVGKPDPRVFAMAAEIVGVDPHEVLVVGDTLPTDILGAQRAGMRAAWLQRRELPPPRGAGWGTELNDPLVRVVESLHEVTALLTR